MFAHECGQSWRIGADISTEAANVLHVSRLCCSLETCKRS